MVAGGVLSGGGKVSGGMLSSSAGAVVAGGVLSGGGTVSGGVLSCSAGAVGISSCSTGAVGMSSCSAGAVVAGGVLSGGGNISGGLLSCSTTVSGGGEGVTVGGHSRGDAAVGLGLECGADEVFLSEKFMRAFGSPLLNHDGGPDSEIRSLWWEVVALRGKQYALPNGNVGTRFVNTLSE